MHDACGIEANLTDSTIIASCGHNFITVADIGTIIIVVDCV